MAVSENISIHLCRDRRKTFTGHIEETLVSSFAEENRQLTESSKDKRTVRVLRLLHPNGVDISYGVGCCLLAARVFGDTSLAK